MKIAIAGIGDVGIYFVEEFAKSGHEIVALTRTHKSNISSNRVEQQLTDYTVEDLSYKLDDCDAVVSTLDGPNDVYLELHLAILEACRRSKRCKKFIPSEWTINIQDFPDQPMYHQPLRPEFRATLRAQTEIKYTLICNGWFADYVLPPSQRHLKEIGRAWMANHNNKTFELYGDGLQQVTLTSVRDVARATLSLVVDDNFDWPEYTFIAGQTLTYLELFKLLEAHDSSWSFRHCCFSEVLASIEEHKADSSVAQDQLRIMGFLRCNYLPDEKTLRWGEGVLKRLHARSVEQLLVEAREDTDKIP